MDPKGIEFTASDREKWRSIINNRMNHIAKWEKQQGEKNIQPNDKIERMQKEEATDII